MKYAIILFLLFLSGCQKEIQWPEEETGKKPQSCKYVIIDKARYILQGGHTIGYLQLGGSGAGWYQHETSTYFVVVHDTLWNRYSVGDFLPINPNQ